MPPLSLLIKPASSACNMRCHYCFYTDIAENRNQASHGFMTLDTLETLVKNALETATGSCAFAFQGGEPTLVGLDFYKALIAFEQKHNHKNLSIHHGLQTNGYLIDRDWVAFFKENNFLIGLSLDGTKEVHDSLRPDSKGKGTFTTVSRAAQLLESGGVDFNILTVVTRPVARSIGKIYNFYKRNNFRYQQYIPCLEPIGMPLGANKYSLSSEQYGDFLISLFTLWHRDFVRGEYYSIRYFDNLVQILTGHPPEGCEMRGQCSVQLITEADGSVYPCDFYALDQYYMGNINESSYEQLWESPGAQSFLAEGRNRPTECERCQWQALCRGGCRRNWEPLPKETAPSNYYCAAYQRFFAHAYNDLVAVARSI